MDAVVRLRTAENRPHAGDELVDAERLRQVVVTAERESPDSVLDRVSGREKENGDAAAVGPKPLLNRKAVDVGEHHVENDELGAPVANRGDRASPGRLGLDLEPLVAQRRRHKVGDVRFVVDHQDPCAATLAHTSSLLCHS